MFGALGLSRGSEGTDERAAWANDSGREMRGAEGTLEGGICADDAAGDHGLGE